MNTKTEYEYANYASTICGWIDKMYAQYGKRIVNVSTSAYSNGPGSKYYYAFVTILQEEQTNNID